ncbi:MAG: methylated-DNA--[protein]-cysteine S-methyltransferase [Deltaproteobacteria bacterium]|nr:methylated-DNA--[protein]-cysteine S-methyltransferase [Deltaproteobacteria bacterium]
MARYIFPKTVNNEENSTINQILKLVEQYFRSHTTSFNAVKIVKNQLTPFQFAVLEKVAALPFGTFQTYGETAGNLGNSNKARAVGNALGANPLPLIIPCHRILSKNGIGGYSSGRAIKQWLLRFEGIPGKYLF